MTISIKQFSAAAPESRNAEAWVTLLNKHLPAYQITGNFREAMFLAQCAHESSGFTRFEENLNYSAKGLRKTFPKYFPTQALADQYARKPQMIANRVYANRMGNVNPNDGYFFRGLGVIQLTGRDNYTAFGKSISKSAEEAREYMGNAEGMLVSALWFWQANSLNRYADINNVEACTKAINGGLNGLEDRKRRYARIINT
ncbi:glycoside hydrolase family 19 protein [Cereibacter changlensis]|uniref:glycoside hydrolase family 19 protein n=1 Tax=Cereibacter changlensis TaxID=402884 RepID=UPI00403377BB